ARVTAGTVNAPAQPAIPMACVGSPVAALKESTAMLALKASLGVTLTTWATSVPCQISGQTTTAGVWGGVLCDSTGSVVSISVENAKLKGSLPTDISTLTALTFLNVQRNLLNYRLDSFTTNLRALPVLALFAAHYNYLYGEIPSFLVGLPKLTSFGAVYNYLIGTVPAVASKLNSLDVRGNFLTDVPTGSYSWCGGGANCLVSPAKCTSGIGSTQRPAADCAICGTTSGVAPFCWGAEGVCSVDASARVTAGTVNAPAQPAIPMACVGSPVADLKESTAMLALKSSLGVTLTTWAASVPCQLAGQTTTAAVWGGVLCDSTGSVVSIDLNNAKLKGSLAADVSTLTALTFLNMQQNLLNYRIDSFTTNLRALPVLADIRLHYNYLWGEVPSFLVGLPKLTNLVAYYNYFIGTVPALGPLLLSLDVRGNFLTDLPSASYTWCGCAGNCMAAAAAAAKCISGGSGQRPAADCAPCGTTNAVGPFCATTGGVCTLDAAREKLPVSAGRLFQASLSTFTANLLGATMLNELQLQYNWLYGSVPTSLFTLKLLSVLDLSYNYLTGSFPATTSLASLDIRSNFFYAVGSMTLQSCAALSNCLATPASCSSAGTTQRPTADCAICGSTNGQPPFCGGTGTCSPDSGPAAAQGTPNLAGSPLLPMVCSGIAIDAADASVLLALKSSLGVTLNNWNAAALCTLEGQTLLPAQWGGVRCTGAGKVTSITLKRQQLKGSIHPDISKLTTLTYLDLGYNLFQGRLDIFANPLKPLSTLKALFFHYNYFAGPIPSAIATLPALTSLGLFSNYLTGTVPIPSKSLLALDVGFNFLSGVFPTLPLMFCAGENNCFVNSTACRTYGSVQRPAGACAICGTAAGQGDLCFGGSCAPSATAAISAGTVNSPNQPILPMACSDNSAAPMDAGSAVVLLNVKAALGVTFTSWLAASPCAIANSSITVAGTWTGVLCSSAGDVLS
ncbi:unnamed protein product, partial [Closterium sp. NIES-54]